MILTTFEVDDNVIAALRAGASGFLAKDADPAEIVRAVRTVAAGDALLSPPPPLGGGRVLAQPEHAERAPAALGAPDRPRARRAATGLAGHEQRRIASSLVVSPLTVKTHVSRILTKTGARDRAQLVALAYESGLVRPGRPR